MKEIGNDILFFPKVLGDKLLEKLNTLIDDNCKTIFNRDLRYAEFPFEGIRGRIEIYKFPNLLKSWNNFWFNKIEDQMYDYYFKYLNNQNQIQGYKTHAKTDWKDVFVQVYNDQNTFELNTNIHCDFSGITVIACLENGYEGGELLLPKQKVDIKLTKGDLILFPGSHTHPHGVNKLISGERRVLVAQSMGVKQLHKFGKEI